MTKHVQAPIAHTKLDYTNFQWNKRMSENAGDLHGSGCTQTQKILCLPQIHDFLLFCHLLLFCHFLKKKPTKYCRKIQILSKDRVKISEFAKRSREKLRNSLKDRKKIHTSSKNSGKNTNFAKKSLKHSNFV